MQVAGLGYMIRNGNTVTIGQCHYVSPAWATAGFFFQGWAMRGSEGRKSPSRVHGQSSGVGLWAKLPETDDIFSR